MRAKRVFQIANSTPLDASYAAQKYASQFEKPWRHAAVAPLLWVKNEPGRYVIEPNMDYMPANRAWKDLVDHENKLLADEAKEVHSSRMGAGNPMDCEECVKIACMRLKFEP